MSEFHRPILLKEVNKHLLIKLGEKYIDATIGGGGHTKEILKLGGKVLGIDCDPEAIKAARKSLQACPTPRRAKRALRGSTSSWQLIQDEAMYRLVRGNFAHLKKIGQENGFSRVGGVLFDLGVSSYQLETPQRGFSFSLEAPLDMRMDSNLEVTAADLVNGLNRGELEKLFAKYGEETDSRRIATAICQARQTKKIETTQELAKIIVGVKPRREKFGRIHPATRCFQALRIAVNDELNNLREALPQALTLLKHGGRLVVISFHSGEDRIVKQFLKEAERKSEMNILTKKPVRPSQEEINQNPRSRSAKLRAGEKI